jgi:hypothetical protein
MALKIFEDLKNNIIYKQLVLASPFARLLHPSTTVRCELSLGRACAPTTLDGGWCHQSNPWNRLGNMPVSILYQDFGRALPGEGTREG